MYATKFTEYNTYLSTKPNIINPIPLNIKNGCNTLNYKPFQLKLNTNSDIYLNNPIWHKPLQTSYLELNNNYFKSRINNIDNIQKIIYEDIKELCYNK